MRKRNAQRGVHGLVVSILFMSGCDQVLSGAGTAGEAKVLAEQVAARALTIGELIGTGDGFGGLQMGGYLSHMEDHMGFHSPENLADPNSDVMVEFHNESDEMCTFDVVYSASYMGLIDQHMEVEVEAGETVVVELPCAEIVGLGSLTDVGMPAVHFTDGQTLDNEWCVPGFLGSDYLCEGTYRCDLTQDVDDLDGDGDTEEFIVTTDALQFHLGPGGMGGHGHGQGGMPMMMGRL